MPETLPKISAPRLLFVATASLVCHTDDDDDGGGGGAHGQHAINSFCSL